MELKRFVLLSDNTILTKKEFNEQRKVDDFYADRLFKKTSDSILDLVEIGDLVKCGIIAYTITDVDRWGNLTLNLGDVIEGRNSAITAIYKRQTNGDYKRYEVVK